MKLPDDFEKVVELLRRLPGIGEKSATRMTLSLSKWEREMLSSFGESVKALADLSYCKRCGLFSDHDLCAICEDEKRSHERVICVVETVTDAMAIDRGGSFQGRFHVLGGVLNPLQGIGPTELNFAPLVKRVKEGEADSLVLAINPSVEGDATCAFIKQITEGAVAVERIGFGIPIGGSLEYLDPMTISKALENRKRM